MRIRNFFAVAAFALSFVLFTSADVSAQGRGGGGGRPAGAGSSGGGRPAGVGQPGGFGQPSGMGVDRGLGTSSTRSDGRADTGRGNASTRSNGRSDTGLDRARAGGAPDRNSDELRRYTGISKKLDMTPEALRTSYETALAADPDLTWGQFVAANVIADNLGTRYPNITSAAILEGLRNGDSIGETLERLGLGEEQAETAEKEAKREIKASKKNSGN
jgi:hypothetical protein